MKYDIKYAVVDIDGTIAKVGDRVKYLKQEPKDHDSFYEAVGEDEPIQNIIDLIDTIKERYGIIFLTGRREEVRDKTIAWLDEHFPTILDYKLLMRPIGDRSHDRELKPKLLKSLESKGIREEDIAIIFEDRNSVVNKWRKLGFTCLQVAEGKF